MDQAPITDDQAARSAPRRRLRIRASHLVILGAVAAAGVAVAVGQPQAQSGAFTLADDHPAGMMLAGWRGGWQGGGRGVIAARLCSDERADLIEDKIDLVETFVLFIDAQRPAWENLADAMRTAGERIGEVCPQIDLTTPPATAPERLAEAEVMMTAGLAVIQEIRPAFEEFYDVLDDQQRHALNTMASRRMWRR